MSRSETRSTHPLHGTFRVWSGEPDAGGAPSREERVTVHFDGEIYNARQLENRLAKAGTTVPERDPHALLSALYRARGERFRDELDGTYALVVTDRRKSPRLFAATDGSGVKTLYFAWDSGAGRLSFASSLPALVTMPGVRAAEHEFGLHEYLCGGVPLGERTMFRGIRALAPGAALSAGPDGGPRGLAPGEEGPWDTGLPEAVPSVSFSAGNPAEELKALLADEAAALLADEDRVFLLSPPSPAADLLASLVTRPGRTSRGFGSTAIAAAELPGALALAQRLLGQPHADPGILKTLALCRAARDAGGGAVLTADGADELFIGHDHMASALAAPTGLRWVDAYLNRIAVVPASFCRLLYTPEYAAAVRKREPESAGDMSAVLSGGRRGRLQRIITAERYHRLPARRLHGLARLTADSGLRLALPFCRPRLSRFAAALSATTDTRTPEPIRTLHAAADGCGTGAPHRRAAPEQDAASLLVPGRPLWEVARDALSETALIADGRLQLRTVQALFREQARAPSERVAGVLWALLSHQFWRHEFFGETRWMAAPPDTVGTRFT
ncbi:asparagine synthase-related protein [Nocardiopsis sp. NPDC049922]|uniref:asparagine synthase-related protein n=1 Tax=Nocardiopsis sp. NPDC049922 TaxID=3155157 RepID=UPI0033F1602E